MMSAYLSREKDSMRLIWVVSFALVHSSMTMRDIQDLSRLLCLALGEVVFARPEEIVLPQS